jgi:Tol biopolymer transport system component
MRRVTLIAAMVLCAMLSGCASVQGIAQRAVHPCLPTYMFAAVWSVDGRQLAYVEGNNEKGSIFLHNIQTGRRIHLRDASSNTTWALGLSHDNQYLAITSEGKLGIVDTDGTGDTDFFGNLTAFYSLTWSPNSNIAVFSESLDLNDTELQLSLLDIDTGSTSIIAYGETTHLVWSPDGTRIAFTDSFNLAVINSDGSERIDLTEEFNIYTPPSWSPDSHQLAFIDDAWHQGAYAINADGTGLTRSSEGFFLNGYLTEVGLLS